MPRGILPLISCPAGVARLKAKEEYHTPLVRGESDRPPDMGD